MPEEISTKSRKRWIWPFGMLAAGAAGAAVVVFRGCWHRNMSWPVRADGSSYRVCLGCGIKQLFDEKAFNSYGPRSYDLKALQAWDRKRLQRIEDRKPKLAAS